jgi:hypothetical protein
LVIVRTPPLGEIVVSSVVTLPAAALIAALIAAGAKLVIR